MQFMQVSEAVELIRMEYAETPSLRLTFGQARRLLNLSEDLCQRALTALTASGFLVSTPDGAHVRRGSSLTSVEKVGSQVRSRLLIVNRHSNRSH